MRLGILGGGRAAWAYGSTWRRIGWPVSGVWLRDESHSHIAELLETARFDLDDLARQSELLLVAVSDRAIPEVLAQVPASDAIVFHASGASPAPEGGFSLHPLRSLPPVGAPSDLKDAMLTFTGEHRKTAKLISAAIGARFAEVPPEAKALYHAAAVFGSNYVAAAVDIAEELMERAGVHDIRNDLYALALSALDNWREHTDRLRFTGPAARGDMPVLVRHREALHDDPQVAEIYRLLAEHILGASLATRE